MSQNHKKLSFSDKRAYELANMPTKQLLGYIATLLEIQIESQRRTSEAILRAIEAGIVVKTDSNFPLETTGVVFTDNELPLQVEIAQSVIPQLSRPIRVDVVNKIQIDDSYPVIVKPFDMS